MKSAMKVSKENVKLIKNEINRLSKTMVGTSQDVQALLDAHNSTPLRSGISLKELLKRPEMTYQSIESIDSNRPNLSYDVIEQVEIQIKYEGYINRQKKQVQQFDKLEKKLIPEAIDYSTIKSLRIEAVQKLKQVQPRSVGQASRISGVSPADISVLLVYLEQYYRQKNREKQEG